MARPTQKDVSYFPFIVKDGKTFFILETKYQCKGIGFFANMCRILAQTPDHHIQINDDVDTMYFFSKAKCDEESGIDMLNIMAKTGKIDKELWERCRVIASEDFLNNIKDAYRNRKNDIITIEEICNKYGINRVSYVRNSQETNISDVDNTHSIKEYSKLKETIFNRENFYTSILEEFYFRNFISPDKEVERFWNHYQGTNWKNKNGVAISDPMAVARNWEQKQSSGKKAIPIDLLIRWKQVYETCKNEITDRNLFLKLTPVRVNGSKITIKIPNKSVFEEMEKDETRLPFGIALRKEFGKEYQAEYTLTK